MAGAPRKLLTLAFVIDHSTNPNRILLGTYNTCLHHPWIGVDVSMVQVYVVIILIARTRMALPCFGRSEKDWLWFWLLQWFRGES